MFIIQEMLETYTREDNDYLRLKLALDGLSLSYEIVSYDNDENLRLLDADFCPINDNSKLNKKVRENNKKGKKSVKWLVKTEFHI